METLTAWGLRFLDEHAEWAIFLILLLEESGIPLPLPGDVLVVLAGVRVQQGQMPLGVAMLLLESATLIGSSILYWLARRGGRPVLYRYGKWLRLGPDRLAAAERFVLRYGWLAIVVGRLVPGLRILISVVAGVFAVPYPVFLPALALGASVYLLVLFGLGYVVGPEVLRLVQGPGLALRFVPVLLGSGVVIAAYVALRRRARLSRAAPVLAERFRLETAIMAGLLATAATAIALDLLLVVLAAFQQTSPTTALVELARARSQRLGSQPTDDVLVGTVLLYVGQQVLWAVLYAYVEPWLPDPDWVGGLAFALVPLAISLCVVLPGLGAGVAGLGLGLGWVPLAGEAVRYAIYGWTLSTAYTLLSQARSASE